MNQADHLFKSLLLDLVQDLKRLHSAEAEHLESVIEQTTSYEASLKAPNSPLWGAMPIEILEQTEQGKQYLKIIDDALKLHEQHVKQQEEQKQLAEKEALRTLREQEKEKRREERRSRGEPEEDPEEEIPECFKALSDVLGDFDVEKDIDLNNPAIMLDLTNRVTQALAEGKIDVDGVFKEISSIFEDGQEEALMKDISSLCQDNQTFKMISDSLQMSMASLKP